MSRTLVRWCLHEKTRSGVRFIQGRLLDFVSRLHVCMFSFRRPMTHDQYDDTTLKRRKLTTHALPVVVHWQTDFKPNAFTWYPWYSAWYRYEISYRSEILAPYNNRGEFTPVLLAPARHFVSLSLKKYRATRGNRREHALAWKPGVMLTPSH